ncbi:MAG: rod shape-determining protein, partial [Lachnospiraceae bacterium]|nr:rod shape-determining protein [Lachnospiraceae bacterium]
MPRVSNKANKKNYVYGLDIGTRSVVGTVGYKDRERFVVVAQEIKEHESRAMLDGQIHDIESVSETIREVTLALIERIDTPLTQVCIAAAGRMLRTVTVHADLELDDERSVVEEDIHLLDSYGVEKAYETFLEEQSDADEVKYYCVGYSIMKYYLNDYPITNLENHKARKISCDMIATFLPDDVVDGLYKAVEMAGLEVANLTLEPIAAIELAIPEQFRMLNIALIDVGAGTSDISITKDGSIIAYGMLPVAGDCLTEDIARHCLVDFNTAESIKRAIEDHSEVEYKDIMGLTQKISRKDVLKACEEHLESMAAQVSDKIRELNGDKPVSAVFVVGGGGKIASYTDRVAKHLDIPKERCALRGEEVMGNIDFQQKNAEKSSLMVTPIGICLNYYEQSNNFIFVTFNEARVKVYDNNHLAVVDAALGAEFSNEDLFPKRGRSLEFILNGEKKVILGKRGESSVITVNGKPADITTPIHKNDVISVIPGTAGEEGSQIVGRLPELRGDIHVKYEDQILTLPKLAMANGELVTSGYEIKQQDRIDILNYYTVSQILEFMDIPKEYVSYIAVNHENSDMDGKVYDNFTLSFTLGDTTQINADSQKSFE